MKAIPLFAPSTVVSFETFLCDRHGRVIRRLQRGRNMITDWGMDGRASIKLETLVNYLHLGSTTETLKRVANVGNDATVTITDPNNNIAVVMDENFFASSDVGKTLQLGTKQELKITAYTDEMHVTCGCRGGILHPTNPITNGVYTSVGVHSTEKSTLGTQTQKYNTYDTASQDYQAELTDSANSRFDNQRIYLSAVVTGSDWTVNQLGWSDGNAGNNCFGKVNLASPDIIPVGNRYRVKMNCYSVLTPIDLSAVTVDWGGVIGSYTCAIRMERIGRASNTNERHFLRPYDTSQPAVGYTTATFTMQSIQWQGDGGYGAISRTVTSLGNLTDFFATYTNGNHYRNLVMTLYSTVAVTSATGLLLMFGPSYNFPALSIKPTANITKPSGYWANLTFRLHWTRQLTN